MLEVKTQENTYSYDYRLIGDTKEEVNNWISNLLKQYHPTGYGTSYSKIIEVDNKFKATAWRSKSCD